MKISLMANLVLFAVSSIAGVVIYFMGKTLKKRKEQIEELNNNTAALKNNIKYLVEHTKDIEKIKKQEKEIQKEIENAKTDEEIFDIVNNIIHRNNELCHN